jgi:ferritin-like protein
MSDYHEAWEALPRNVRDVHRALRSLIEELEAVDWYHQRVALCEDDELRAVLAHNRDEEIEHACMTLEWVRRNMDGWDRQIQRYIGSEGPIVGAEHDNGADDPGSLKIGSLRGRG